MNMDFFFFLTLENINPLFNTYIIKNDAYVVLVWKQIKTLNK